MKFSKEFSREGRRNLKARSIFATGFLRFDVGRDLQSRP